MNIAVAQSGGPTCAINASLVGVFKQALKTPEIDAVFGSRNGIEGIIGDDLVDLKRIIRTNEDMELLRQTPSTVLGSCRRKLPEPGGEDAEALYKKIFECLEKHRIEAFFYIGGNDSMDTVHKLSQYAEKIGSKISFVGVPKTIDNDLPVTDHTPGFGSAAKYIAVTMQEIIRDCSVYTLPAVTIVEIMGRDAGWLTAASAIGRAVNGISPDLVYLPEHPFDLDAFFARLRERLAVHPGVVVAVSEGIRFADGRYVCEGVDVGTTDVFGHKQLSGTGKALELAVRAEIGCKVRSVELNLPQRCAGHIASAQDLTESVAVGRAAVAAAREGVSREMMTILRTEENGHYAFEISHSDVSEIANKIKSVPAEFINAAGDDVTDECCRYLLPLIKGEAYPEYRDGIPDYAVI